MIDADIWIDKLQNIINDEEAPSEYKDYCLNLVNEIETELSSQVMYSLHKERWCK